VLPTTQTIKASPQPTTVFSAPEHYPKYLVVLNAVYGAEKNAVLFERGTLVTDHGVRIVAGKMYWCRLCKHTWWFEEKKVGDVPACCNGCGSAVFDHPNPRMEKKTKIPLSTNIWQGAVLGARNSREWDF